MTMNKTIWQPPIGTSVTAYNDKGEIIVVIPFRGKGAQWMMSPIKTGERLKVEKAVKEQEEAKLIQADFGH